MYTSAGNLLPSSLKSSFRSSPWTTDSDWLSTINLNGAIGAKYSLCLMSLLVLSVNIDGAASAIIQITDTGNAIHFRYLVFSLMLIAEGKLTGFSVSIFWSILASINSLCCWLASASFLSCSVLSSLSLTSAKCLPMISAAWSCVMVLPSLNQAKSDGMISQAMRPRFNRIKK